MKWKTYQEGKRWGSLKASFWLCMQVSLLWNWLRQEITENVLKTTLLPNGRKRWIELCICLCFTQLSVNVFHPAIVSHVKAPHWVSVYAFEENRLGFRNSCQLQAGDKKMDVLLNWLLLAGRDLPLYLRGWVMSSLLLKTKNRWSLVISSNLVQTRQGVFWNLYENHKTSTIQRDLVRWASSFWAWLSPPKNLKEINKT